MLTQPLPHSAEVIADATMARFGLLRDVWSYDYGVVWRGMEALAALTGSEKYAAYIYDALDSFVSADGEVRGYHPEEHNLDHLCNGRQLLWLFDRTGEERFRLAALRLRTQLDEQPRTSDGGFWHKDIYPFQMWLDGQHMAIPFYIGFERRFGRRPEALSDAARQLILAWRHTLNPETGLPCHGWDEKRVQPWADPETGRAAHAWGRAVGWYMVALCDSLELLPPETPGYQEVLDIFQTLSARMLDCRWDGVWLQVLDEPGRTGNYAESSGSCLIDCAILKGARLGLLPAAFREEGLRSFASIQRHFIGRMNNGEYFVAKCCRGAGLGGATGRDGSFDYYISEPVVSFDLKATGAFIQAACEAERE
ncbi:MAG: glycoside hydrolase family 88 protein [Clostridia bacterium]|nr:glycoside hydrolase family 88 protein [Clostridia bacterium]